MKVDNTTNVAFNQKRNTVRITTKDRFAVSSVWIADMLHVPFGVSFMCDLHCLNVPCSVHVARRSSQICDIEGELSSRLSPRFFATSVRSIFCIMPVLTPLARPPYVYLVLRLARFLVSSLKLALRWRNRHVRRRQHGAQFADLVAHRARLHRRQCCANEYARQLDRLLLQDKLE